MYEYGRDKITLLSGQAPVPALQIYSGTDDAGEIHKNRVSAGIFPVSGMISSLSSVLCAR
jgi:hypothetical protein